MAVDPPEPDNRQAGLPEASSRRWYQQFSSSQFNPYLSKNCHHVPSSIYAYCNLVACFLVYYSSVCETTRWSCVSSRIWPLIHPPYWNWRPVRWKWPRCRSVPRIYRGRLSITCKPPTAVLIPTVKVSKALESTASAFFCWLCPEAYWLCSLQKNGQTYLMCLLYSHCDFLSHPSQEYSLTIEWSISNLSTFVENIASPCCSICALRSKYWQSTPINYCL